MNEIEHLLVCLAEEAAEVQQAIAKALRFGLDDKSPTGLLPSNREYIVRELIDIVGVLNLLKDRKVLEAPDDWDLAISAKEAKVLRFMEHARNTGALK